MNKADLIASVARASGQPQETAARAVDAILDTIVDTLAAGGEVRLVPFGKFSVIHRSAANARNPRTGEAVYIPPSRIPRFKAGKRLKDTVNV